MPQVHLQLLSPSCPHPPVQRRTDANADVEREWETLEAVTGYDMTKNSHGTMQAAPGCHIAGPWLPGMLPQGGHATDMLTSDSDADTDDLRKQN